MHVPYIRTKTQALAPLLKFQRHIQRIIYVSIRKGWLTKSMCLCILFCIPARLLHFFLTFQKCHSWNCPQQQPVHLVKVLSFFFNHGNCMGQDEWTLLNRRIMILLSSSLRKITVLQSSRVKKGPLVVRTVIQVFWVLLSLYSALPSPKNKQTNISSILETFGEESWVEDSTTLLVRKFFLYFFSGLSPFSFCLAFRGLQHIVVHCCLFIITSYN